MNPLFKKIFARFLLSVSCCSSFMACVTSYATTKRDDPSCTTVVSGYFSAPFSLSTTRETGKRPCLITKKRGELSEEFGEIVQLSDSGVVFKTEGKGFSKASERFIPRTAIVCLVDDKNRIIVGNKPRARICPDWSIECTLTPIDSSANEETTMVFEDGKTFSFCIAPGLHSVSAMSFIMGDDRVDKSRFNRHFTLDVQKNVINYLGEIFMDSMTDTSNTISVPFTSTHPMSVMLISPVMYSMISNGDNRDEHRLTFHYVSMPPKAVKAILK